MPLKMRVAVTHEAIDECLCQARLADPRLPRDVDDAPLTGLGLVPAPHQQIEFLLSAKERRRPGLVQRFKSAFNFAHPKHLTRMHRLRKALNLMLTKIAILERRPDKSMRLSADQEGVGFRE